MNVSSAGSPVIFPRTGTTTNVYVVPADRLSNVTDGSATDFSVFDISFSSTLYRNEMSGPLGAVQRTSTYVSVTFAIIFLAAPGPVQARINEFS